MVGRLTLFGAAVLMGAGGLLLVFQGLVARVSALPATVAAPIVSPAESIDASGSSSSWMKAGPRSAEWTTLQADRALSPLLNQVGAKRFHAGLGLAVAAWIFAFLVVAWLPGRNSYVARWVSLVWLLPAAWALWVMGVNSGPRAESAAVALQVFRVMAPVYGLFLLLGLYFSRAQPHGS